MSQMCFMWSGRRCLIFLTLVLLLVGLSACSSTKPSPTATATAVVTAPTTATPAPSPQVNAPTNTPPTDSQANARQNMVEQQLKGRDISDEAVLAAMTNVPRHEFVPDDYLHQAYNDHPLPIGHGQTISQPYIVALMTQLVDIQPGERVLEIGTGSGYQAAILGQLTDQVYTIEIIPELAERAQSAFDRLGYDQIVARQADGYWGWEEYAPFEAIVVTAAPDHIPQPLVKQLADGGKMIIPVGPPGGYQSLWLLEREGDQVLRYNWGGVRFVPFTRNE